MTKTNIGWVLTVFLAIPILGSAFGKLSGDPATAEMLNSHFLNDWILLIGIGELVALILFLLPKSMRLGALLLSAYFGGAIMFHMAHPEPINRDFIPPAAFLIFTWIIAWLRGLKLIT